MFIYDIDGFLTVIEITEVLEVTENKANESKASNLQERIVYYLNVRCGEIIMFFPLLKLRKEVISHMV